VQERRRALLLLGVVHKGFDAFGLLLFILLVLLLSGIVSLRGRWRVSAGAGGGRRLLGWDGLAWLGGWWVEFSYSYLDKLDAVILLISTQK
jgi:hypothetical protein